ncbi:MAG: hypothetical protein Q4E45_09105, partial [Eubacteriales bacterium]|nr:hypothetical protein [Eubacteriales bacterium]
MKKFCAVLAVVLMVTMLATSAFAVSISAYYSGGKVHVSASDVDTTYDVLLDGKGVDAIDPDHTTCQIARTLEPGTTHKITLMPGGKTTEFT